MLAGNDLYTHYAAEVASPQCTFTCKPTNRKRPRPTALKDYTRHLGRVGRFGSQPCPTNGPTATR